MFVCVRAFDLSSNAVWQEVLDALDALTPLIEDVRCGVAVLDMHGAQGDFTAWSATIRSMLARYSFSACVGAGPNRFCAFAAAQGEGMLIEAGGEAMALAPMPLDV